MKQFEPGESKKLMTNETITCAVCGQPKLTAATGSLPQSVSACRCDETTTPSEQNNNNAVAPDEDERQVPVNSTKWILIATILSALSFVPVALLIKAQMERKHEGGRSQNAIIKKKPNEEVSREKSAVDRVEHLNDRKQTHESN
jgi:hypothetical protein